MKRKSPPRSWAPFIGARSFKYKDRSLFFGREKEILDLTNRILANHVVLLHSVSGAGKTSLIAAGLIPKLEEMQGFRIMNIIHVNRQPEEMELADCSIRNRYILSTLLSLEQDKPRKRRLPLNRLSEMSLSEYLARRQWGIKRSQRRRTLLVFDQFEEILNLNPIDIEEKKAFFAWLRPALYDVGYWTLFAIRDDFVGALEPYLGYFPNRLALRFRLEFLGYDPDNKKGPALDAIQLPTSQFGVEFERDAALKVVDDLCKIKMRDGDTIREVRGIYIEPIHLQVVCQKIWKAKQPDQKSITLDNIEASGTIESALEGYFNDILKDIAGNDRFRQRNIRDWIERQLTTPDGLRNSVRKGAERTYFLDPDEDVAKLIGAYLIRPEQRLNDIFYELAHDRLVRPIQQANNTWRQSGNNLDEWQRNAETWFKTHEVSLLMNRDQLNEIQGQINPSYLSPVDQEYINASQEKLETEQVAETRRWKDPERLMRVKLGTNLEETGWGVIFPEDTNLDVYRALEELFSLRKEQAGRYRTEFYHEFIKEKGYRRNDTPNTFLERHGAGIGFSNPEKMPYYLLIVGDPATIPFEFQYGLDQQYAVGRIYFDSLVDYQNYARSVKVCESGTVLLPNSSDLFVPLMGDGVNSWRLAKNLARPLAERLRKNIVNWRVDNFSGEHATFDILSRMLGAKSDATLLLIASQGKALSINDPNQRNQMGCLICSGWGAQPDSDRKGTQEVSFCAENIDPESSLLGMVVILIGDYTAGTPLQSDYDFQTDRPRLTNQPFLARLPQNLLSHMRGGALAVIAHVDRLWTVSPDDKGGVAGIQVDLYYRLMERLMSGYTVGSIMDLINRNALMSASLIQERLQNQSFYGKTTENSWLFGKMQEMLMIRNFILIGDPAVCLPIDPSQPFKTTDPEWQRPSIQSVIPLTPTFTPSDQPEVQESDIPETELVWDINGLDPRTGKPSWGTYTTQQLMDFLLGER